MLFKSEIAKFVSVLPVYYALVILIVIFSFFLSIYNNLPKTNQLTKETNKQATKQTNKLTRRGHQLIEAIIMIKISCTIISTSWSRLRCVLSCPQHTLISVTTLTVFSKNDTTIEVNPTKEKSREKTISLPFELMLKKHQEPGACMWQLPMPIKGSKAIQPAANHTISTMQTVRLLLVLVERSNGRLMPQKRSMAIVALSRSGHSPQKTIDIPMKLQKWQLGSTWRQLKRVKWKETTMEPVTKRPIKSVTTRPPRKIKKKDRDRFRIRRKDLTRTMKAMRFEVIPKVLKMVEKYAELMGCV